MRKLLPLLLLAVLATPLLADIPFIVDGDATNSFIVLDMDPVPIMHFFRLDLSTASSRAGALRLTSTSSKGWVKP